MKFITNVGTDRVLDCVKPELVNGARLDVMSNAFSMFAFAELMKELSALGQARIVIPSVPATDNAVGQWPDHLGLLGTADDRQYRNKLQSHWLARELVFWLETKAEVRAARGTVPQGTMVLRDAAGNPRQAALGSFGFTTEGLGIAPGNPLNLIQASENSAEACVLSQWFETHWAQLDAHPTAKESLLSAVRDLATHRDAASVYALVLQQLFATEGLDEEKIVKSATGIRNTVVWKSSTSSSVMASLAQ